jgi:hypothetical protein
MSDERVGAMRANWSKVDDWRSGEGDENIAIPLDEL